MDTSDYIIIGIVCLVTVLIITIILWRLWIKRRKRRQEQERIANMEISSPLPDSVAKMKVKVEDEMRFWRDRKETP